MATRETSSSSSSTSTTGIISSTSTAVGWSSHPADTQLAALPDCPLLAYLEYARLRALMLPVKQKLELEQACTGLAGHLMSTAHHPDAAGRFQDTARQSLFAGAEGRLALHPDVMDCPDDYRSPLDPDGSPLPALRVSIGLQGTQSQQPPGAPALSSGAARGLAPELDTIQSSYGAHAWLLRNKQLFPLLAT
jgi:hypothetical protein